MTESPLYQGFNSGSQLNLENERLIVQAPKECLTTSLLKFLNTLSKMLKSSEGRNKLCGLIQYIAKFSAACIIYTIDTNEIKNNKYIIE